MDTISKLETMMEHITYDPNDQTFKDKQGRDCKVKKSVGYWYIVKSIDGKKYSVLAHHFVYYSVTKKLPPLRFIDSKDDLSFNNLKVALHPKSKDASSDKYSKIYVNIGDIKKLKEVLTKEGVSFALSKSGLKLLNNKRTEDINEKSKGIFPIKCGNTFALICSESNLIQLDHSGPNL